MRFKDFKRRTTKSKYKKEIIKTQPKPERKKVEVILPGNSFDELYQSAIYEIEKEYIEGTLNYVLENQKNIYDEIEEVENSVNKALQLDDNNFIELKVLLEKWTALNIECSRLYLESCIDYIIVNSKLLNDKMVMVFKKEAVKGLREEYPELVLYSKMEIKKIIGMNDGKDEFKAFIRQIHSIKKNFSGWIDIKR